MNGHETWQWLTTSPLFGITLTLVAYKAGRWVFQKSGHNAFAQPVLITIVAICAVLLVLDIDYDDYLIGASYIGFLLGPATVALALPLHHEWDRVTRAALPILTGVVVGALVSITSAVLITRAFGGNRALELTMAPKAATSPVSFALSTDIGGIPALTVVVTIIAGITGAVLGPWILDLVKVRDERARGIAIGASSHGIGTARALHESRTEGAFSALAMALTALGTSVLLPVVLKIL